jgi:hypothetical protein
VNPRVFAEWLEAQGERVVETPSSWWHSGGARVYQAFPYHWTIEPRKEDFDELFRRRGALAVRYSAPCESPRGLPGYQVVYDDPAYDLSTLSDWARKNVRRGLRNSTVEPISFDRFDSEAWLLRADSLDRQCRETGETREKFHRRFELASRLEGFEFWGAFVDGRMGAFLVTFRMEDCCNLLLQQCHRDFLKAHVNNALAFEVTQRMLARSGIRSIFYGMESLDAPPSVDEFKFRMGYRPKAVRQCVVFHPLAAPLVNGVSYAAMGALSRLRPSSRTLSKARGMMRIYLEGGR